MKSIILLAVLEIILDKHCKTNKKLGYKIMFPAFIYALLFNDYIFLVELVVQFVKYISTK